MVVDLWSKHFVILITTVFVIVEYVSNLAVVNHHVAGSLSYSAYRS